LVNTQRRTGGCRVRRSLFIGDVCCNGYRPAYPRRKRWACTHGDCDRIFEIDAISSTAGVPKKGVCPDHPTSRVREVWIEEQINPGLVDWPAVQKRLREPGIVLVGGEAPEVYKRLPDVLAAHGDTIRVKHTLRPLGVAMGGRDVHDPHKD
jgi:hypothetical protein